MVLLADMGRERDQTVLTFWDGAAADEPGYAEEASNQIGTGYFSDHVGYWERPGVCFSHCSTSPIQISICY